LLRRQWHVRRAHRSSAQGCVQGEAGAAPAAIPDGKELHIRSTDSAAEAMGDLLLGRGGMGYVRRIFGQFFDRPVVRSAMGDGLKECAQPYDQRATQVMIDSAKAFFTGAFATRGRSSTPLRPWSSRRRCARTSKCGQ
jgi:hypothetical protein